MVSGAGLTCSRVLAACDAAATHPETFQRPSDSGTSVQLSAKSTRVRLLAVKDNIFLREKIGQKCYVTLLLARAAVKRRVAP